MVPLPFRKAGSRALRSASLSARGALMQLPSARAPAGPARPGATQMFAAPTGRAILRGVPALLLIHGQSGSLGGCGGLHPVA
jgi:hypothetical protein